MPRRCHLLSRISGIFIGASLLAPLVEAQVARISPGIATGRVEAPTHEESVIRTAYARAAYSTQVGVVSEAALHSFTGTPIDNHVLAEKLHKQEISYTLSNFAVGNVEDILDKKWGDLVTVPQPPDKVLQFHHQTPTISDVGLLAMHWDYTSANWTDTDLTDPETSRRVAALPLREIIRLGGALWTEPDVIYTRYATYNGTVSFDGLTISYRSTAFFGKNSKGQEKVAIQDNVGGGGDLDYAVEQSFYPVGLLRTRMREIPAIQEWLNLNQSYGPKCVPGLGELCCTGSKCSVSGADLQNELSIPLRSSAESN